MDLNDFFTDGQPNIMTNNEFRDSAIAVVNQYNPVFNFQQSPEFLQTILKNQEQITKLIEAQNILISNLLHKK